MWVPGKSLACLWGFRSATIEISSRVAPQKFSKVLPFAAAPYAATALASRLAAANDASSERRQSSTRSPNGRYVARAVKPAATDGRRTISNAALSLRSARVDGDAKIRNE